MWLKSVVAVIVLLVCLYLFRFRKNFAAWARYLYFMRFAILLWTFPLLLVGANTTGARSLLSGIVTPSQGAQYLCVAFFLVSSSFVALILARIVVINGAERFGSDCPPLLGRLLAEEGDTGLRFQWIAPIAAQLNTFLVFLYFRYNGGNQGIHRGRIDLGFVAGAGCALLFWYIVNLIYYLTYRPAAGLGTTNIKIGRAAASTLLFPRSWLFLTRGKHTTGFGDVLEMAELRVSLKGIARAVQIPGYRWPPSGDLYEGHYLSLLALIGLFSLYLTLWPLTAPVPVPFWSRVAVIAYLLSGVLISAAVWTASLPKPDGEEQESDPKIQHKWKEYRRHVHQLRVWKIVLTIATLGFCAVIPALYYTEDAARFPIFALVLILGLSTSWVLAGVAFFADRYRLPVLTAIIVLAITPRAAHWDDGREEHYLSTTTTSALSDLPTPSEILNARSHDQPLIIVTSTGGGIHAAAWTTAVLGQLEEEFAQDGKPAAFHDHLLLLSTVSGGSSGLYAYLRELNAASNPGQANWDRMNIASSCSSLEAVGWGLVYHDIPKAFIPFLPYLTTPSPGVGDLFESPLGKDRTWALRRAFERNLNDPFCWIESTGGTRPSIKTVEHAEDQHKSIRNTLTLANLSAKDGSFPAFSMNTTSVEDGARFLLANYRIPDDAQPEPGPIYKARSFMATFGPDPQNPALRPDLSLATAAQMSATFPYVSSQARVPLAVDSATDSLHFADGGYYDNDGTASAIEFLRYALTPALTASVPVSSKPAEPIHILLIEIRNSDEISGGEADTQKPGTGTKTSSLWNALNQVEGPLEGFWSAGHASITARDQAGLEIFERAYDSKVKVHAIVIGDTCAQIWDKTDPLNWALTPVQKKEVAHTSQEPALLNRYKTAKSWFDHGDWNNAGQPDPNLGQATCKLDQ